MQLLGCYWFPLQGAEGVSPYLCRHVQQQKSHRRTAGL